MLQRRGVYAGLARELRARPGVTFADAVALVQARLGCSEEKARRVLDSPEFETVGEGRK